MSKKTNAAKQTGLVKRKPPRRHIRRRKNSAAGDPILDFLGGLVGMVGTVSAAFVPRAAPPEHYVNRVPDWVCTACQMTLCQPPGVPAGFVPYCPSCRKPMLNPRAAVRVDGDTIDAEFEDVTPKQIGGGKLG